MALRKHLRNGKTQDIQQHEFERTVTIRISRREGSFQLLVELFGEGNIILVNPRGIIVSALVFRKMRDRNVLRNETYRHAPASGRNPVHTNRAQIVRAVTKFLSIGGLYAEELLLRANVDKNTPCQELTDRELDEIHIQLGTIMSHLADGKIEPAIITDEKGEMIDVIPTSLKKYERLCAKQYKTFNEALDEYYMQTGQLEKVSDAQIEYKRELSKLQRMLQDQQKTIEDSKKAMEQNRHIGDLIYMHFNELQLLAQEILEEKRQRKTWDQIVGKINEEKQVKRTPSIYFVSLDPKRLILNVSVQDKEFSLKMTRSIQANAAEFYERMKKAERKLEGSEKALKETQGRREELHKLWTQKIEETRLETPPKPAKKAWYEKFRWAHSSDGFLLVAGKDATTNEILIKKHMEPQDIVFHAEIVGAPFVVVKTQGGALTDQVIRETAQFAASYSRAWREALSVIDVYWIKPDQISKTPPSGQFLEKGSFIIKGTKNYVRSIPLRVGIGLQMKENQLTVIGGPAESVSKQADCYVEILPAMRRGRGLAKKIRGLLVERAPEEWREKIGIIRNEEFQSFIPFGRGEVIVK
jgi:predicted ribosome quality control (RQC) complex YloA/Tae2 family protein